MAKQEQLAQLTRSFEVLGNPLRFQIFLTILSEGCDCDFEVEGTVEKNCVKGIMRALKLPQSTVSMYIKDLVDAGLVETRKVGRVVYSRPNRKGLIQLKSFTDGALAQLRFTKE